MVDSKVTDLTEKVTGAATDEFYINDVAGGNADKKLGMDGIRITNSQITDFAAGVSGNAAVTANTAKVTNQTHTGDVTGSVALTIAVGAVDIAMLSATGTPDGTTFLRGDNTWAVPAGSGDMVLASAQTNSGAKTFLDTTMLLRNVANTFNGSFVNTNTADRVYTLQDSSDTLVGRATTDTLTNKTINTASNTITVVEADISDLGAYITASSVDTLTNKTFDANATGNSLSNIDIADHSATGTPDATTFYRGDNTWATPAGSGDMVLAGVQTVTGAKTFADDAFLIQNPATTFEYLFQGGAIVADRTITLPVLTGGDTLVFEAHTQTLTNKTIDGDDNTIVDINETQQNVSVGAAGTVLTSNGVGLAPTYQAAGGGSQTPWTQDIDADTFALTWGDVDAAAPAGTVEYITNLTAGLVSNVATGLVHDWQVNNVSQMTISATTIDFQANTLTDILDITSITSLNGVAIGDYAIASDNLSVFAATTSAQLAGVISDETGTGSLVFGSSPTIVTPTIASFTNATHDHTNAAGGGQIAASTALSDFSTLALVAGDVYTGVHDFGGATALEVPNAAAPDANLTVAGRLALDTTITSHDPMLKYYDGTQIMVVPAIPLADLTTTDNDVIAYSTANTAFTMEAQSGAAGGSGTDETIVKSADLTRNNDDTPSLDNHLVTGSLAIGEYTFECRIFVNSTSGADFQYLFGGTATFTGGFIQQAWSPSAATQERALSSALTVGTNETDQTVIAYGRLVVTSAGTFGLSWAQDLSQAGDTTLLEGSSLIVKSTGSGGGGGGASDTEFPIPLVQEVPEGTVGYPDIHDLATASAHVSGMVLPDVTASTINFKTMHPIPDDLATTPAARIEFVIMTKGAVAGPADVRLTVSSLAVADTENFDQAFAAETETTVTMPTATETQDVYTQNMTTDPVAGDTVLVQLGRDPTDPADDFTDDIQIVSATLWIQRST